MEGGTLEHGQLLEGGVHTPCWGCFCGLLLVQPVFPLGGQAFLEVLTTKRGMDPAALGSHLYQKESG